MIFVIRNGLDLHQRDWKQLVFDPDVPERERSDKSQCVQDLVGMGVALFLRGGDPILRGAFRADQRNRQLAPLAERAVVAMHQAEQHQLDGGLLAAHPRHLFDALRGHAHGEQPRHVRGRIEMRGEMRLARRHRQKGAQLGAQGGVAQMRIFLKYIQPIDLFNKLEPTIDWKFMNN